MTDNEKTFLEIERNAAQVVCDRLQRDVTENFATLPVNMHPGIARYILFGVKPGSFLRAAIADDQEQASCRADHNNRHYLAQYRAFMEAVMPKEAWGSYDAISRWSAAGGLNGHGGGLAA